MPHNAGGGIVFLLMFRGAFGSQYKVYSIETILT